MIKKRDPQTNVAIPRSTWESLRKLCTEKDYIIKWFVHEAITEKMERENENTTQTR